MAETTEKPSPLVTDTPVTRTGHVTLHGEGGIVPKGTELIAEGGARRWTLRKATTPATVPVEDSAGRDRRKARNRRRQQRQRDARAAEPAPAYQAKHGKFGSARAKILRRVARGAHGVARSREMAASYGQLRLTWRFLDRAGRERMGRQCKRQLAKYRAARLEQEAARVAKAALEGTVDKRVLEGLFP